MVVIISKSNVFIHVGLQKTGTTWIQCELFNRMKGINYVHNMDYTTYFNPDRKTIISMEWLCGIPYWNHVPYSNRFQMIDRLHRVFPDAGIILGVRDKRKWVISLYSQYVKNGGVLGYDDWYRDLFDNRFLNFTEYINYIKKKFRDVCIYNFEDLVRDKDRTAKVICDFVGEPVPPYRDIVYNRSFNSQQLGVMRWCNRFFKSTLNPSGFLPKTLGSFERFLIKKVSGSWQ